MIVRLARLSSMRSRVWVLRELTYTGQRAEAAGGRSWRWVLRELTCSSDREKRAAGAVGAEPQYQYSKGAGRTADRAQESSSEVGQAHPSHVRKHVYGVREPTDRKDGEAGRGVQRKLHDGAKR